LHAVRSSIMLPVLSLDLLLALLLAPSAWALGSGDLLLAAGSAAPAFEKLRALSPEADAVVSSRPVFQLQFDAVEPEESRRMRFRIVLTAADSDEKSYVFDQRRRRSGWLATADGTAVFRPPRSIDDGRYAWHFAAWNGVEWVHSIETRKLRVDSVPPADVEAIQLQHDREGRTVHLTWKPVVLDQDGSAEFVTRYHVYRYSKNPDLPHVRAFEVGVVEIPEFTDGPTHPDETILFYRIAAEDEAGNVSAREGRKAQPR
jgi:hypothetical protein